MAHGIESRVPFLDHSVVELAATVPADLKFTGGRMKHLLKQVFRDEIPAAIAERRDKMGFPVPLKEWFESELAASLNAAFESMRSKCRPYLKDGFVTSNQNQENRFSRDTWALYSLELWHQDFHDRSEYWKSLVA